MHTIHKNAYYIKLQQMQDEELLRVTTNNNMIRGKVKGSKNVHVVKIIQVLN